MPGLIAEGSSITGKVRKGNEDAFRIYQSQGFVQSSSRGILLALSDGMGGYQAGAEAAWLAVDQFANFYHMSAKDLSIAEALRKIFFQANKAISDLRTAHKSRYGMGATLTTMLITPACTAALVLHAGDSSAYLLRGTKFVRLTTRHQDDAGALTQHMGVGNRLEMERVRLGLQPGDRIMLCSDGVDAYVPKEKLQQAMSEGDSPAAIATRLTDLADEAGGVDNATAVVAFITPDP
jgi:serine/threonine protein phosphatase PrpC